MRVVYLLSFIYLKYYMKIRKFKDKNYKAIFNEWKTIRIALDSSKPILELDYPEFYDLKITNYCSWWCKYCYQESKKEKHYDDIIWKTKHIFWWMSDNEKPFQIAIGGGNPNEHPDFISLCKCLKNMWIMPNYTTNGMWLTNEVIKATKEYCWWVAITCHLHLVKHRMYAIKKLTQEWIKVNLHILISDKKSIDMFKLIYDKFSNVIDYFVLLPLMKMWRQKQEVDIDYTYLENMYEKLDMKKIAFGANFYPYLRSTKSKNLNLSLYEPEIMSKYIDLDTWYLFKSSFDNQPRENLLLNYKR
jgi:organic radical activating enzyme